MKGLATTKTYKEDQTTGEEGKQDNKLSTCAQQCTMIAKNKTWNVIVATEVSLHKTTVPYLLNSGETTLSHFPFSHDRKPKA